MKNLKYYIQRAYKEGWAIGQFNFSDFSELKAIVNSAVSLKSPIILGTSEGESGFIGLEEAVLMRNFLRKKTGLPIFLNLDHGKSFEYLKKAINAGYDMVHFDGSKLSLEDLPASATQKALQAGNISISKKVVAYAKWRGVLVEGEVGRIGTDASRVYEEKFEIKEEYLTKPEEAVEYVKKTSLRQGFGRQAGVDVLAVSVGTFHGIDAMGESPHIRLDRLKEIREKINIPMVLHGGSGTPENDIKESIKLGIVKININTEIRKAFAERLLQDLQKGEIVPYKFLPGAMEAVSKVVEDEIRLFGSENKA